MPKPGLVHRGHDKVQEAPTMYFVSEASPTRCFVVCAYSGDHAKSLIKEEFPNFNEWDARVIRLQRGLADPYGVLDVYELADASQPQNQNPLALAAIAMEQE